MMKKLLFLVGIIIPCILFSQATITIDPSTTYQTIDGFGGFGPKKVWWNSGPYYDQEYIDLIIDDLGANIIRTQVYWDFEESNDNGDPNSINWSGFNYGPSSNNGKQYPFMMDLAAKGDIKQIATLWTPPTWMKLYSDPDRIPDPLPVFCGYNDQCGGQLNLNLLDEFAEYCLAYIQNVKNETGVDIYALSLQNELRFANAFEACVYTPEEMAQTVHVVGNRFESEGLNTYLFGPEDMAQNAQNQNWVNAILRDDPVAREHMDIWAVHGYQDGVAADYGDAPGWTAISESVRAYDKRLWMTETSDGDNSGWDIAFKMARALHLALKHGKINAWVYWYMTGDLLNNSNSPTSLFYTFKQYYKNIRPGAVMIDCESSSSDILCTAFTDGENQRFTAVLINNSSSSQNISFDFGNYTLPSSFTWIYTSNGTNYSDQGTISNNTFALPANSVNTIMFEGSNHKPQIDQLSSMTIVTTGETQSISLTGISDGGDGGQTLSFSATTTNSGLTGTPTIDYSAGSAGTLNFTPVNGQVGEATITIQVTDNGDDMGGLNTEVINMNIKIIPFVNAPPTCDDINDITLYIDDGQQIIEIDGLNDGNDGSQIIYADIDAQVPQAIQTAAIPDGNKLLLYLIPQLQGDIPITITLTDNGGTDLGGSDTKIFTFTANIKEGSDPNPQTNSLNDISTSGINIYPNPAHSIVNIISENNSFSKIIFTDIFGRTISSFDNNSSNKAAIDISSFEKGVYFAHFFNANNKIGVKQFIIE